MISLGAVFLATLSAPESFKKFGNTNYYLFHQIYSIAIGFALAFFAFKIPLRILKKILPALFFISIIASLIVLFPAVGAKLLGAKRWINIGDISFQPSELLKITAILYLSLWLSIKLGESRVKGSFFNAKRSYNNLIKIFLPFIFFLALIVAILAMQKDLGTLSVIIISLLAVYFASGTPLWHTVIAILTVMGGALALIRIEPYRIQRLLILLNPEKDPLGIGFHLRQSLLAVGSGGIFGKGLGTSSQKFGFLPEAMGDSIFAIIGEETGIVGCGVILILFTMFFIYGIKIAYHATDRFSYLAVIGISTWIVSQAFINIGSAIGIFPVTGIPLPFVSYGGSHIIAEMIGVGIMLNISKNS